MTKETETMLTPVIQNIVCTCNLGSTLYLPGVARNLQGSEYNPKRFSAVTYRLKYPKTTALFFGSGKMVCTGAKNKNEARLAIIKYVQLMEKRMSLQLHIYDFHVQNMVASANVGFPVSLEKICMHYGKESSYEPELFPGLIFRMDECPAVFLIFLSGRLVITGAKCKEHIKAAFDSIVPILLTCKAKQYEEESVTQIRSTTIQKIIPESQIDWSLIDITDDVFSNI